MLCHAACISDTRWWRALSLARAPDGVVDDDCWPNKRIELTRSYEWLH